MATLRTPLEVALGVRLDLDFSDLDLEDLDQAEKTFEASEADALDHATATGEFLFREAVRSGVPAMRGAAR